MAKRRTIYTIAQRFAPYAHRKGINWQRQQKHIKNALTAANQVNVQDIIATGVKGPEIREALNHAKHTAIAALNESFKNSLD